MIKHYTFENDGASERPGRVAISVNGDKFNFASIAGPAPQAWVLAAVLADNEDVIAAANEWALLRRNQYAVVRHNGMSGAKNYHLIERRDDALADYPTRARLHISMYGKLNEGVRCWLGDLPPLLAAALRDGILDVPENPQLREEVVRTGTDWRLPGGELLTTHDNGTLSWDRIDGGTEAVTEDMPLLLGEGTLARIREALDFDGIVEDAIIELDEE